MSRAPKHPREEERLEALRQLHILDTLAENEFDEITRIAAQICGVPVAMISLIDENRQFNKAKVGLEVTELHRDDSFCAHGILQSEPLILNDVTLDPRFADNVYVANEPHVRFYAGAPIVSPDNLPLGMLCVLDKTPRQLEPAQVASLEALANQVNRLLVLRQSLAELKKAKALDERRQRLEVHLLAASNTLALGEMAAGVAHEINTPLSVIQLTAEILQDKLGETEFNVASMQKDLQTIEKTVSNIAKMVGGLRTLARPPEDDHPQKVNMNSLIASTFDLCEPRLRAEQVVVELEPFADVACSCCSTQVAHILVNLLNNAGDAIRDRDDKWIRISANLAPETFQLVVTDSGPGIPAEIAEKLTQPFFTTKTSGRGAGLNLNISKTIAQNHGGDLRYDPNFANTTFVLTLPRAI